MLFAPRRHIQRHNVCGDDSELRVMSMQLDIFILIGNVLQRPILHMLVDRPTGLVLSTAVTVGN